MSPKKKITFYTSFEEMENDQLQYYASLTPEELLRNHKILSLLLLVLKKKEGLISLSALLNLIKNKHII